MKRRPLIIPAGAKGQEGEAETRTPKEEKNNLRSQSYARVLDLVSEGPIVGLVTRSGAPITNPLVYGQGIYLNGTPMIAPNGRANFAGVKIAQVFGTQNQPVITGFASAEETIQVDSQLKHNVARTVEILDSTTTAILVAVKVNTLFETDKKTGDISGTEVEVRIVVRLRDVADSVTVDLKIEGKTQSEFVKEAHINLPRTNGDEDNDFWTIVVTRRTEDANTAYTQNETFFSHVTRVVGAKLRYPNSAIVACQFDAKSFSSVPTRAYHVKGRIIRVPANYHPPTRSYKRKPDGTLAATEQKWDGTWWTTWSDNPAWCFFDLCTNPRYGLGEYLQAGQVDKWRLYEIARYCDQQVTNPANGKKEPRYTCNLYLQDRQEAIKVLTDMASIFRGFCYWAGGTIIPIADMPKSVLRPFTNANVKDGLFTYSSTAKRARHTVALVRWNDPSDFFNAKFEYISDDDGIAALGIREIEITGFGCTRRGQAIRMGKWALASELLETEIVRFTTGFEGLSPKPGDIIEVYDQNRAGVRHGGRIVAISVDRKTVTIDKDIDLAATGIRTIKFVNPTAFIPAGVNLTNSDSIPAINPSQTITRTVTTGHVVSQFVSFADALPAGVIVGSVWAYETGAVAAQTFRVLAVREVDRGQYEIEAAEHNPSKFGAIDNNLRLEKEQITRLPDLMRVADPLNFRATEGHNDTPEGFIRFILLSWKPPLNQQLRGYIIEVRRGAANWDFLAEITSPSHTYNFTEKGTYQFRLFAVNAVGVRSSGVTATIDIDVATSPTTPPAVTGLEVIGLDGVGKGNDPTFVGRNVSLQWRLNSAIRAYDFGGELMGAAGPIDDPYFQDFEIRVFAVGATSPSWYATSRNPRFDFTYEMNREAFGNPANTFTVRVNARDKYNTPGTAAEITPTNPAPADHVSLTLIASFRSAFLSWVLPPDADLSHTEVWQATGTGSSFGDAVKVADVAAPGTVWANTNLVTGTIYRFWLRAIDTFGSHSNAFPPVGSVAMPGRLPVSDLDNLAVELTGAFAGTIALKGAVWSDNTPAPGRIAWNVHQLAFAGVLYDIDAGNTPVGDKYVWWRGPIMNADGSAILTPAETHYRTSALHPKDTIAQGGSGEASLENDFIVATNAGALGIHDLAWRGFANALIGSAWIRDAAIKSAQIDSLGAEKIVAGDITSQVIRVGGVDGALQSVNYVPGVSGWMLRGDGNAEFANLVLRERLALGTGYFNEDFPDRRFYARPEIICPIKYYNSGWQQTPLSGSPNKQTLHSPDGVTRTRGMVFFYSYVAQGGYLTAKTTPTPWNAPLFFGVDRDDYLFTPTDGSTGLFYRADPRRLAYDGVNVFTIEAYVRGNWGFSVWYQVADNPVWEVGGAIKSMGNRRGPNATPSNVGAPWEFACEMLDSAATSGYQYLSTSQRVEINVPANKVILFGIGPVNRNGGRDTTVGSWILYNGFLRVVAENVGNPLPNQDPPDEDGS